MNIPSFSLFSIKYPPPLFHHLSNSLSPFSPSKPRVQPKFSKLLVDSARVGNTHARLQETVDEVTATNVNFRVNRDTGSRVFSSRYVNERKDELFVETLFCSKVMEKESAEKRFAKRKNRGLNMGFLKKRGLVHGDSSSRYKDKKLVIKNSKSKDLVAVDRKTEKMPQNGGDNMLEEGNILKRPRKSKDDSQRVNLRVELDMCSKRGDVMGAIELYDMAQSEGIKMEQYHYTVILYLCSSAAVGVVHPSKSGGRTRILNAAGVSNASSESSTGFGDFRDRIDDNYNDASFPNSGINKSDRYIDKIGLNSSVRFENLDSNFEEKDDNGSMKSNPQHVSGSSQEGSEILVSEEIKKYAFQRGFEIYEKICLDNILMNEASLTAMARMAMTVSDGEMAFDMVNQIKSLGINPRLRSYGPALSAFCSSGDIDKAFEVEKHMLENGVYPEEPELEALLRVSVEAGKGDKVYYLLHRLRTTVRSISPVTADIITKWFRSKAASRVGKKKLDLKTIKEAIKNGGGGWYGHGWLGRGKWVVSNTVIGTDGFCKCCGEKLSIIDLDPMETENFARSVASLAMKREKNSNFQRFQKWLDYYGPFEAVVDAANVGLFSHKRFMPSKVNTVVNGIRQMLPSRKWPLIVLHNRRITGPKMDEPSNKALIEKWRNADALYATPTGSNDDWYWLYAAIKFKCLIVTNDEMRDHTFQLLGNDFFPKWKERHQVHFSFSETGLAFHMPPPYSVVIQESEKGHWHIPIASTHDYEEDRTWLCIGRANSLVARQKISAIDLQHSNRNKGHEGPIAPAELKASRSLGRGKFENGPTQTREIFQSLRDIVSGSDVSSSQPSLLSGLEAAEKLGGCLIDFQI